MNDKIKELAEHASHQSPDGYPVTIPYSKDFAKKFAELIIGECLYVISKRYMGDLNREDQEVLRCIDDIKDYFGLRPENE